MRSLVRTTVFATTIAMLTACGGSEQAAYPPSDSAGQKITQAPAAPAAPYRLSLPPSLLGGTYKDSDPSEPDENLADGVSAWVDQPVSVRATYDGPNYPKKNYGPFIAINGVHGTVLAPAPAREEFLRLLDHSRKSEPPAKTVIGPKTIVPAGSSEPLSCRVVERAHTTGDDFTVVGPECSWADASAIVNISESTDPTQPIRASDIGLAAFATKVATIRNEIRAPLS
ncbi:hypothetical protein [Streptomyces sp. NPDC048603]|uniref:hypothetical protein n=1 Tax=Streptomyces sp. NPDC048603 TaxID=3365577 RepID=UPI003712B18F